MSIINRLGRSVARLLSIRHSRRKWRERPDADFPPKHPDYLRRILVAKYDAQFTKDVFKVYDKGITGPSVRRHALVLPLTAGPSQVIPIPLILDTGAPEFISFIFGVALTEVGALTQHGYNYQLYGCLQCPGDVEV